MCEASGHNALQRTRRTQADETERCFCGSPTQGRSSSYVECAYYTTPCALHEGHVDRRSSRIHTKSYRLLETALALIPYLVPHYGTAVFTRVAMHYVQSFAPSTCHSLLLILPSHHVTFSPLLPHKVQGNS